MFQKKSYTRHEYGDPTYLSFFLMWDWEESPLFNGKAVDFLENILGEPERAEKLRTFKRLLQRINAEMPWYFQSIEGFENVYKFEELKSAYRGSDEGLTIQCLETVDLTIAGLMDMYRDIAFDMNRWIEVLPHNMTYFNLYVIVSDCRTIASRKLISKTQTNDFADEEREYIKINDGIAATAKAHFMVKLKKCSFSTDAGTAIFGALNSAEPAIATNNIKFKYQIVEYYSKQYLNSFEGTLQENKMFEGTEAKSGGNTSGEQSQQGASSEGDRLSGRQSDSSFYKEGDIIKVQNKGSSVEKITGFDESLPEEDSNLGNIFPDTAAVIPEIEEARNRGGIGENLLNQALATLEGAADRLRQDALAKLFLGNVYGLNAASNVRDAITAGSINGIRNLVDKTQEALNNENNSDGTVSGNVFPETQNEKPLPSSNAFDTVPPPEKDSNLGNIFPNTSEETPLNPSNINE